MPPRIGSGARLGLSLVLFAALIGCGRDRDPDGGSLTMDIRTTVGGIAYRLRDATFAVTPVGAATPVATINTETDPDAPSVEVALGAGPYTIELAAGWRLEKQIGAAFQTVNAALTSQNPAPFTVVSGQTTPVAYAFQTDAQP